MESANKSNPPSSLSVAFFSKMLDRIEESPRSSSKKRNALQRLLDAARAAGDLYGVVRLLIPQRDLERQNYNMKEAALASCLVVAFGIAPKSADGHLLLDWKRATNSAVGDFSIIASQVMAKRQHRPCLDLSITALNSLLDCLTISSTREAKGSVLRELISKITAGEMKWILRIILKDLRIGLGENSILDEIHPDARDMMAACVDLKNVCLHLHSRSVRYLRQDLVVGKPVKCQHSKRMNSIDTTWEFMKGKEITAECKFDGDRMQVHKDKSCIQFWSRNGKEHDEYNSALGDLLQKCILSTRCILDGELLVWDSSENRFKQRTKTSNQHAASAARKGFDTTEQVCYVIFDILYEEKHGSIIHLPLKERRRILKDIIQPSFPQVVNIGEGNTKWSIVPTSKEELADFFVKTVQQGDEGIVVKDLNSQWCPDNRDGRWCKIKPDYVSMGNDLDLLIIGGYYGRSQYGGQVVSYLLALVDNSEEKCHSSRFISICRCGIGLSEEDRSLLHYKLAPLLLANNKGRGPPSSCNYLVTNSRYECPDVWVSKPEMSVVVQVSSEQRIYPTSTFKAGWTFRFPRIVRVRNDKCWSDSLHMKEFEEMVQTARLNGNSLVSKSCNYDPLVKVKDSKRCRQDHFEKYPMVISRFRRFIPAPVARATGHLDCLVIYICNLTKDLEKEKLFAHVQQSGGKIAMNLSQSVTHVFATEPKGVQYNVAVSSNFDVIHISWLLLVIEEKELLPILPRHYLHLSNSGGKRIEKSVDRFGDPWFDSIETEDLVQIFQNIKHPYSSTATDQFSKIFRLKFSRSSPWGIFHDCHIHFYKPIHSRNPDSQYVAMMALRRFRLEAEMRGASISNNICDESTHVVVYAPIGIQLSFRRIMQSLSEPERKLVQSSHMCIVTHAWIEECIRVGKKLDSALYSLRNEENLASNPASSSIDVNCKPRHKVEKALMQSVLQKSSDGENQSPSNKNDSIAESSPMIACGDERKTRCSLVSQSESSEPKIIDKSGFSLGLSKDCASDVVENMTQIFLGAPLSAGLVQSCHSFPSNWEKATEYNCPALKKKRFK